VRFSCPRLLQFIAYLALLSSAHAAAGFPFERNDLPADPQVTWGRLPNGLRYAVRKNQTPPGVASLRLVVFAGSLHESDDQRGYAHFVEHMAFSGTRAFPHESLVQVLRRQGMAGGPDLNAVTSLASTTYKLDIPEVDDARLREGLHVFREFSDAVTFEPDQVDRERGVVLSERRARDSRAAREHQAFRTFAYAETPFADRNPLGDSAALKRATPERLRAFYQKWYRPDNIAVVVVGDVDIGATEKLIESLFADLALPQTPLPGVDLTVPTNPKRPRASLHRDPEGVAIATMLVSTLPMDRQDTREGRIRELRLALVFEAFNRRLIALQERLASEYGKITATHDQTLRLFQQSTLQIDSVPTKWRDALRVAENELRRAMEYGFTKSEIEGAKKALLTAFERQTRAADTRASVQLAESLGESLALDGVFTEPATRLRLAQEAFNDITLEECAATFRSAWGPGSLRIYVGGKTHRRQTEAKTLAAYKQAAAARLSPPEEIVVPPWPYTDFGTPGKIRSRALDTIHQVHQIVFENGIRLNLKPTDFQSDQLHVRARFGSGSVGEPADKPGLHVVADREFLSYGLKKLGLEEVRQALTGTYMTWGFSCGETAFYFNGECTSQDTLQMLQLFSAYLLEPGWRKDRGAQVRNDLFLHYFNLSKDSKEQLNARRLGVFTDDDPRYGVPSMRRTSSYTVDDLREWMGPQLREAPLEIGFVGQFDVEKLISEAAQTLGALPPRDSPPPPGSPVHFIQHPVRREFTLDTQTAKATVDLAWPIAIDVDHLRFREIVVAGSILHQRLVSRLREQMGITYAPSSWIWHSDLRPAPVWLVASVTTAPADLKRAENAIREIAADLATRGVDADEFERARQPFLKSTPAQLRSNEYLIGSVTVSQSEPQWLEWIATQIADFEQIRREDVNSLFARVLKPSAASVMTARPKKDARESDRPGDVAE
jgi:zinc protease